MTDKPQLKERAYRFTLVIINTMDNLPWKNSSQILANQLLRSATSIGANIIEAQAGRSRKNFGNYFNHALKSANETKFWLALLRDTNKLKKHRADQLLREVCEISNILGKSILTLKNKN